MCHSNYNIHMLARWKFQGGLNELQCNCTSVFLFLFCYLKGSGFESSSFVPWVHTPTRAALVHTEPLGLNNKRNVIVKRKTKSFEAVEQETFWQYHHQDFTINQARTSLG